MTIGIHFDDDAFKRALDEMVVRTEGAVLEFVTSGGHLIEAAAKDEFEGSHAKGQPHTGSKPNVVTGTARRSIAVRNIRSTGLGMASSETGPAVVYGRRLELGFHGTDSLGRHYDQPGYAFLSPGLERALPELSSLFTRTMDEALRS